LLRRARFVGFALQPGFISGAFFAHATATSFLAIEVMKRPASEFGLWFFLFPAGYLFSAFASGRIGSRASIERMAMAGSGVGLFTAALLGGWLALDGLSMPALFVPGFFIGVAQGLCLPYAQAGAMAVDPDLAGSASGAVVFSQLFWPAALQQLTGFLADGTWRPMVIVVTGAALCSLAAGAVAVWAGRPAGPRPGAAGQGDTAARS
jgi:DHA1 family bicyclomycin/chloramphenicol resistance-like MFS transporter